MTYRKLIGLVGNEVHDGGGLFAIAREEFEKDPFIIPFDLASAGGVAQHTRVSTSNSPLNIFMKDAFNPSEAERRLYAAYAHTNSDALLQLSKLGATLSM